MKNLKTLLFLILSAPVFAYQGGTTRAHNHTSTAGDGGLLSNLSVSGTFQANVNNAANVMTYGAKGDGVTDDSTAFQAAVNASSSVYIPCNTYMIGTGIVLNNRSQTAIFGAGPCSVLKQTASNAMTMITISTGTDIWLKDFTIDGNYANEAGANTSGGVLVTKTSNRVTEQNLTLQNIDGPALQWNCTLVDPSVCHDNAMIANIIKNDNSIGGGMLAGNRQNEMRVIGNRVNSSGGTGEAARMELQNSVVSGNVFVSTTSIAFTLNGGESTGEFGQNTITGNYFLGHDIGLEVGNDNGMTEITGNHIEQEYCAGGCTALSFTGSGASVSSNTVISGNVIIATHTLVGFGSAPLQTTWTGNLFRKTNPNDTSNWFNGTPSSSTFISNIFDGENMVSTYNIFSQQLSNVAMIGNVFNCGVGSNSNAIQVSGLSNNVGGTFLGNKFTNCTNTFLNGGFDYQIGDKVEAVATATSFPATTVWGDLTSITLTPGTWAISGLETMTLNGATATEPVMGISTTSGNSASGLVEGQNRADYLPGTAAADNSGSVPSWHQTYTANTTVYLKMLCNYSAGTPKVQGRLTAIKLQ